MITRLKHIEYLGDYSFAMTFTNGETKNLDLTDFIFRYPDNPNVVKLQDKDKFSKAYISDGDIAWEDGLVDIACWDLYDGVEGKELKMEEVEYYKKGGNIKSSFVTKYFRK